MTASVNPHSELAKEPRTSAPIAADFPYGWVVLLLPFFLAAVSTSWLYPVAFNITDSWIYYGYLDDLPQQIRRFPDRYFRDRLPWLLPAAAVHSSLPTPAGHLVLKLSSFVLILGLFYRVAVRAAAPRAAFLATLLFGCYPVTLAAMGWYSVDSAAVCYSLLATTCLLSAADASPWRSPWWCLGAGAGLAGMLILNAQQAVLLPGMAALLGASLWRGRSGEFVARLATHAVFVGCGAALTVAALAAAFRCLAGDWSYLHATSEFMSRVAADKQLMKAYVNEGWRWAFDRAFWLTVPGMVVFGASGALGVALAGGGWRPRRTGLILVGNAVCVLAAAVALRQMRDASLLEDPAHPFMLTPVWFLALAPLLDASCASLGRRSYAALVALALAVFAGPLTEGVDLSLTQNRISYDDWRTYRLPPHATWAMWTVGLAGGVAAAAWSRSRVTAFGVVVGLAVAYVVGPTPYYTSHWRFPTGGRDGFLSVVEGQKRIRQVSGGRRHMFCCCSTDDPRFYQLHSIACAELSFLNWHFNVHAPRFEPQAVARMPADSLFVILASDHGELAARSQADLAGLGVTTTVFRVDRVGGSEGITLTYLEVVDRRFEGEHSESEYPAAESVVAMANASAGAVRLGVPSDHPRFVTYGPYISLAPGRYRATYRVAVSDVNSTVPVARCDAVCRSRGESLLLGRVELNGGDFSAPMSFRDVGFEFTCLEAVRDVEFRVENLGKCDVAVDFTRVDDPGEPSRVDSTPHRQVSMSPGATAPPREN